MTDRKVLDLQKYTNSLHFDFNLLQHIKFIYKNDFVEISNFEKLPPAPFSCDSCIIDNNKCHELLTSIFQSYLTTWTYCRSFSKKSCIKMPQGRRKAPFSGKAKKEQLKSKKHKNQGKSINKFTSGTQDIFYTQRSRIIQHFCSPLIPRMVPRNPIQSKSISKRIGAPLPDQTVTPCNSSANQTKRFVNVKNSHIIH